MKELYQSKSLRVVYWFHQWKKYRKSEWHSPFKWVTKFNNGYFLLWNNEPMWSSTNLHQTSTNYLFPLLGGDSEERHRQVALHPSAEGRHGLLRHCHPDAAPGDWRLHLQDHPEGPLPLGAHRVGGRQHAMHCCGKLTPHAWVVRHWIIFVNITWHYIFLIFGYKFL